MKILLAFCLLAAGALAPPPAMAQIHPPSGAEQSWPLPRFYQREHPQHRLAYWYANESMGQAREARDMLCGFTGQHWALDWELHYRWGLRATPRRVYQRVEERDQHLATCRSRKLRDYRRDEYRRDPGSHSDA
ncbi:MAG: hypothetical protein GVY32_11585 [Gammaproteobacteria bacterium]|nr:hypothetical protein [Gammaproteobacteria bacterium]